VEALYKSTIFLLYVKCDFYDAWIYLHSELMFQSLSPYQSLVTSARASSPGCPCWCHLYCPMRVTGCKNRPAPFPGWMS